MALDLEAFNRLPGSKKALVILVGVGLLMAAFYMLLYEPQLAQITALKQKLTQLQRQIQEHQAVARDLPKFREENQQLRQQLAQALQLLPDQKEIPSLLSAVSRLGRESGLEFLLFKPGSEVPQGFYARIPVEIEVTGTYHQLAHFFDQVGRLPRIVNIHNLNLGNAQDAGGQMRLRGQFVATTYRFVEPVKAAQATKDAAAPKK
ncbi:MAG: type 4a pilus biogenesis protein PilO [Deltaproteobacteria bacterium]|nr:type 4a pilus biogenesis protein PilO [Deltaproteobacteria bacterium]MBI3077297.1 type 4a pilus biogenesis protein PilO [Deltaproteobacteria bacterium]